MTLIDTFSHNKLQPKSAQSKNHVFWSFTPRLDEIEYCGRIEEIYELNFHGSKPLTPVIFKCHSFYPDVMRQTHSNLGLVEIRQDYTLPGDKCLYRRPTGYTSVLSSICVPNKITS
jgi:hypothetical protein